MFHESLHYTIHYNRVPSDLRVVYKRVYVRALTLCYPIHMRSSLAGLRMADMTARASRRGGASACETGPPSARPHPPQPPFHQPRRPSTPSAFHPVAILPLPRCTPCTWRGLSLRIRRSRCPYGWLACRFMCGQSSASTPARMGFSQRAARPSLSRGCRLALPQTNHVGAS